jgi:hypothetical protein
VRLCVLRTETVEGRTLYIDVCCSNSVNRDREGQLHAGRDQVPRLNNAWRNVGMKPHILSRCTEVCERLLSLHGRYISALRYLCKPCARGTVEHRTTPAPVMERESSVPSGNWIPPSGSGSRISRIILQTLAAIIRTTCAIRLYLCLFRRIFIYDFLGSFEVPVALQNRLPSTYKFK